MSYNQIDPIDQMQVQFECCGIFMEQGFSITTFLSSNIENDRNIVR